MDGRKAITTFARTFIGSHYLWGSAGAHPGHLNGARYRPGSVPWNEPSLHVSDLSSALPNVTCKVIMSAPDASKTLATGLSRPTIPRLKTFSPVMQARPLPNGTA